MSVYKQPKSKYWSYRFKWHGKEVRKSTKITNKRAAEQMEAAARTALAKGEVGIKDLKPALRSKVDDIVAQTSEEEMQSLRKAIDATPAAASALKAKGLSSSHVVAINIADGVLTLFAKTA